MPRTVDRGLWAQSLMLLFALSACGGGQGKQSSPGNGTTSLAPAPVSNASALEALAVESGAITDSSSRDPEGGYGRSYEGGHDRLCLVAEKGASDRYRLGAEIRIGDEEYCRGRGRARHLGNSLKLDFDGGKCVIVARYEGDRVVIPGAVDTACAGLCNGRGTLAGTSFVRIDGDSRATALGQVDDDEKPLCR